MFSTQLKKYRKNNGYTQKQLAEAVGVTQQAVAKWETDKASPDPEMLQKISSMLNVTVDSLLDGATPKDKSKMPNTANIMQNLQTPAYDPKGEYSVVYTWGITGIVYNPKVSR